MKVDWKYLATTKGYKSLKAAYIHDVQDSEDHRRRFKSKPMREKAEFLKKFDWVISRAIHYSAHTGRPMESILDEWEEKRSYWWLNYYQDCNQPKFRSNSIRPEGVNGIRKRYKKSFFGECVDAKHRVCKYIQEIQKNASKKTKPRWKLWQKQEAIRRKKYA